MFWPALAPARADNARLHHLDAVRPANGDYDLNPCSKQSSMGAVGVELDLFPKAGHRLSTRDVTPTDNVMPGQRRIVGVYEHVIVGVDERVDQVSST